MDEAIAVVREVYAELAANGPGLKQFDNAKSSLHGCYLLRVDTSSRLTNQLLGLWIDGLPPDYAQRRRKGLEALDGASATRVARRYFVPEKISTLVLTPPEKANSN